MFHIGSRLLLESPQVSRLAWTCQPPDHDDDDGDDGDDDVDTDDGDQGHLQSVVQLLVWWW